MEEGVWLWTLLVRQARVQYPPGSAPPERYFFPTEYMSNEEKGDRP
jgi:hypothetical protein